MALILRSSCNSKTNGKTGKFGSCNRRNQGYLAKVSLCSCVNKTLLLMLLSQMLVLSLLPITTEFWVPLLRIQLPARLCPLDRERPRQHPTHIPACQTALAKDTSHGMSPTPQACQPAAHGGDQQHRSLKVLSY